MTTIFILNYAAGNVIKVNISPEMDLYIGMEYNGNYEFWLEDYCKEQEIRLSDCSWMITDNDELEELNP